MVSRSSVHVHNNTGLRIFLDCLFESFSTHELKYGVHGNYENLPDYTGNDVDIWVADFKKADNILRKVIGRLNCRLYIENRTVGGANYFIETCNNEIIHIDIMVETLWRSILTVLDKEIVASNISPYKSFYVVNYNIEIIGHFIYPLLTFGLVKDKYKEKIYNNIKKNSDLYGILVDKFGVRVSDQIVALVKNKNWQGLQEIRVKAITFLALRALVKKPIKTLLRLGKFVYFGLRRWLKPRGIAIAFIGNDGCGKTTIKDMLEEKCSKLFISENCRTFYWRPYIFPEIREMFLRKNSKNLTNVQGNDQKAGNLVDGSKRYNKVISCLKLFYYIVDYNIGYFLNRSSMSRAGMHIYDRYYDDLLVYPERFSMTLPPTLVRYMRLFIPQPDIVFFIHANKEIIQSRKKEVVDSELERQIQSYLALSKIYPNIAVIDGGQSIDMVLSSVIARVIDYLAHKD